MQAQADQYRADPEAVKATIDAFPGTAAAGLVGSAEHRASANTAAARAEYDRVRQSLSPRGDAAAELRNARTLQRVERDLGQAGPGAAASTAAQLIGDADPETRGVLLQELPSILASRGIPAQVVEKAALASVVSATLTPQDGPWWWNLHLPANCNRVYVHPRFAASRNAHGSRRCEADLMPLRVTRCAV